MENGIIINGIKHIPVKDNTGDNIEDGCKNCSLLHLSMCCYNLLCDIFDEEGNSHFEIEN